MHETQCGYLRVCEQKFRMGMEPPTTQLFSAVRQEGPSWEQEEQPGVS
jgi:hypothetical protein